MPEGDPRRAGLGLRVLSAVIGLLLVAGAVAVVRSMWADRRIDSGAVVVREVGDTTRFAFGRVPQGNPRNCPAGGFSDSAHARLEVGRAAAGLLAATNSAEPGPRRAWTLMDRTLRAAFGSFEHWAVALRQQELDNTYSVWGIETHVHHGGGPLAAVIRGCGSRVGAGTWMAQAYFMKFQGVAGGALQMFFVMRPAGPRLWFVY